MHFAGHWKEIIFHHDDMVVSVRSNYAQQNQTKNANFPLGIITDCVNN